MEALTIVIFGITGDLSRHKLLPALFSLWKKGFLPEKFSIIGFSRKDFSDEEIRKEMMASLPEVENESEKEKFLSNIFYKKGVFDSSETYKDLSVYIGEKDDKVGVCSSKIFYLAVPPTLYESILTNIRKAGLHIQCGGKKDRAKILIEKPFGDDMKTAEELDFLLGDLFDESQIYRIDHYLGKETLQNILSFRFSNTLFEPLWNNKHIDKIEISLFEKNVVGDRGAFYDNIGALKDVGQNHMLAMLSLIAMEQPVKFVTAEVRKERGKVLKKLSLNPKTFSKISRRAQYEGYLAEKGVREDSQTETFFSIEAFIKNRRWSGVPFVMKSGKAFKESKTEIKIFFRDPDPRFFLPKAFPGQEVNTLTFRIQPNEGIEILFWVKVPGFENKIEPKTLSFNYADSEVKIPDAYERILYDCISGDQTLFPTTEEITYQWEFIEKVIPSLKKVSLEKYEAGSDFEI